MEKITKARGEKIARLVVIFVVVACWLFLALPAQATGIGFVKNIGTNQSKTAGTSISVTVPAAGVKAGNSIIVTFAMDSTSGSVSVSDTAGNTYNLDADTGVYVTYVRTLIFSAHNVTALVSGNTITVTHPSVNAKAVSANEFSGLAKTSALALDKTSTATGDSTTPSSGSTATTTQADELLIGAIGVEGPLGDTFTAGSGYTALPRMALPVRQLPATSLSIPNTASSALLVPTLRMALLATRENGLRLSPPTRCSPGNHIKTQIM